MIRSDELVAEGRSWLGVPFLHQGRSRLGLDCVGFIAVVLAAKGVLPAGADDVRNYSRLGRGELRETISKFCTPLPLALPGCLILIRWPRAEAAAHIALCTGKTILHCYERAGGVVEHGYRAPWPALSDSFWRVPGVG